MNKKRNIALTMYSRSTEPARSRSALEALMRFLPASNGLNLSFEDLTGITYEHQELRLSDELRYHTGPLCIWAKKTVRRPGGMSTCALNKFLANRRVQKLKTGFVGFCHMGLTDICLPLHYRQQLLGVFYYGSFVLSERSEEVQDNVRRVCREMMLPVGDAMAAFENLPRLREGEIDRFQSQLAEVARLTQFLLDSLALPADVFEPRQRAQDARLSGGNAPKLVINAIKVMAEHLDQPLNLKVIAGRLHCHPNYLSRVFRKAMAISVGGYLERMRVERACVLLRSDRLDATRIAYEVGFSDKSNFGRSFRKITGMSPGASRDSLHQKHADDVVSRPLGEP